MGAIYNSVMKGPWYTLRNYTKLQKMITFKFKCGVLAHNQKHNQFKASAFCKLKSKPQYYKTSHPALHFGKISHKYIKFVSWLRIN